MGSQATSGNRLLVAAVTIRDRRLVRAHPVARGVEELDGDAIGSHDRSRPRDQRGSVGRNSDLRARCFANVELDVGPLITTQGNSRSRVEATGIDPLQPLTSVFPDRVDDTRRAHGHVDALLLVEPIVFIDAEGSVPRVSGRGEDPRQDVGMTAPVVLPEDHGIAVVQSCGHRIAAGLLTLGVVVDHVLFIRGPTRGECETGHSDQDRGKGAAGGAGPERRPAAFGEGAVKGTTHPVCSFNPRSVGAVYQGGASRAKRGAPERAVIQPRRGGLRAPT